MKKKILRISAFVVLLLVALLIALPYIIESKAGKLLKANVNNNINGEFNFSDLSLSLYSNFPNARVALDQVILVNKEPFKGDTLFSAARVDIKMGILEFFESTDDPIEIQEIKIKEAKASVIINEEGEANYDIALVADSNKPKDKSSKKTILSLESYEITDATLTYADEASNYLLIIEELNHSGKGNLSEIDSELQTRTEAIVSFSMDGNKYLDRNTIHLDSRIGVDLENNRYTFKESEAHINRLPLSFEGFVILREDEQEMDLTLKTISSDFKNFLALIPEKYSKDISGLETRGNFDLAGHFHGILGEETIPAFSFQINAQDASFKYPELPKKVEHIYIDALVENKTGRPEDTSIHLENAAFQIDDDVFKVQAILTKILGNMGVVSHASGSVNLDNLSRAYPVPASVDISGRLTGDINAEFSLDDIEKRNYKNISLSGDVSAKGLNYAFDALPNPLKVHTLKAELGTRNIDIKEIAGITGSTDFSATGTLQNALGFLFNEEVLKGNFEMKSNSFVVSDLIQEESEEEKEESEEESFKIPTYLNLYLNAIVGKAVYDNVVLYDLSGKLRIKDEEITFSEISSRMLDGRLIFDGIVSTKDEKPSFSANLDMSKLNIGSTFETIELMKLLSPAANALDGRLNTTMTLSGNLTDQLDLDFNSLTGNVLAEILTAKISPEKAPVTSLLDNTLGFVALDKLDLSGLKTAFAFENGQVRVKPFKMQYEDISVQLSGGHTFSNALDYQLSFDVPAKYMGDNVNKLLAGIGDESLENITVPVVAKIGGSYGKPEIKTDLKAQAKLLTDQLVEIQKEKYIKRGQKEVNKLIGNVLAGNETKDTETDGPNKSVTKTEDILSKTLKNNSDSLDGISEKESEKEAVKEAAKSILGGLLNSKTKRVTAKDTLN